jgi:hypothetical protein
VESRQLVGLLVSRALLPKTLAFRVANTGDASLFLHLVAYLDANDATNVVATAQRGHPRWVSLRNHPRVQVESRLRMPEASLLALLKLFIMPMMLLEVLGPPPPSFPKL